MEALRTIVAVLGGLIVLGTSASLLRSLVTPGLGAGTFVGALDSILDMATRGFTSRWNSPRARQLIRSRQGPFLLVLMLWSWMGSYLVGYALLLWPWCSGLGQAFRQSGSSLVTLGIAASPAPGSTVLDVLAGITGLIVVALQIAYLPTLYAAFNRREIEVSLVALRAGRPAWGPELLARTHYALGTDTSTLNTLPDLYAQWERWAADVAESHTTYLPLVRFRSPQALSSWVTALLAVLDSAALFLALSPKAAPEVPARLCIRSGFLCFNRIARAMGIDIPDEADPEAGISLTYGEFLEAVTRMREVDFPIEREPAQAWTDFIGWRVNYERAAYAVAAAIYAVPAKWSGPRRHPTPEIAPIRPPLGRPPK